MTGLSVFILILGVVWLLVLLAMYVDHRRKMQRIEAVEDRLDQGAAEAETRRKTRPTPLHLLPPDTEIETAHDYVNDCLLVTATLPDGTKEHHAIGPDDVDSLFEIHRRKKFLMRDALARQKGLNVDGTVRRETVPQKHGGYLRDDLAQRQHAREREERRLRDEADYAPSIVLPSVYDRPEPSVCRSTYVAPADRPDDGMRGGGFTTGGSFGGESFSSGSDSGSSSSSDSSSSSSSSD